MGVGIEDAKRCVIGQAEGVTRSMDATRNLRSHHMECESSFGSIGKNANLGVWRKRQEAN